MTNRKSAQSFDVFMPNLTEKIGVTRFFGKKSAQKPL
jgi:hypothetical protein